MNVTTGNDDALLGLPALAVASRDDEPRSDFASNSGVAAMPDSEADLGIPRLTAAPAEWQAHQYSPPRRHGRSLLFLLELPRINLLLLASGACLIVLALLMVR